MQRFPSIWNLVCRDTLCEMTDVRSDVWIDFTGCVEAGEAKEAGENVAGNFSKSA